MWSRASATRSATRVDAPLSVAAALSLCAVRAAQIDFHPQGERSQGPEPRTRIGNLPPGIAIAGNLTHEQSDQRLLHRLRVRLHSQLSSGLMTTLLPAPMPLAIYGIVALPFLRKTVGFNSAGADGIFKSMPRPNCIVSNMQIWSIRHKRFLSGTTRAFVHSRSITTTGKWPLQRQTSAHASALAASRLRSNSFDFRLAWRSLAA